MKPLLVSEPASQELAEAVRWYNNRRPGWGGRLFDAVAETLRLIETYPEVGSPRRGRPSARQLAVRGFPYFGAYRVRPDDVYVVAIAHAALWAESPATLLDLHQTFRTKAYRSLVGTLDRLYKKGLVRRERATRSNAYSPTMSREELATAIAGSIIGPKV